MKKTRIYLRTRRLLQNCKIYRYEHDYRDKLPKHLSTTTTNTEQRPKKIGEYKKRPTYMNMVSNTV